jgi:hypothetical protein
MRLKFRMEGDTRVRKLISTLWPFMIVAVVFICVRIAGNNPVLIEDYYSDGFYTHFAGVLSSVSRLFPFSLWDLFWFIAILSFLAGVAMVIFRRLKFLTFCLRTAQILSVLYAFFYFSWGFNYFRPDIENRIGLDVIQVDGKLFRSMLDSVITLTNINYTTVSIEDYPVIDREVEESFSRNSADLDITYPNGYRRPKSMIFSNLIAKFGISGYFGPFFNEINLNRRILPMEFPFLLAHEKAHQFGVSSEADANLVAFVVCTTSEDPKLKYSGYLALLLYFLEDAQHFPDYREYLGKLDKPVIEELQFRQQYYFGLQNEAMGKAHETVYDAYLKTNHIPHGIENYNQVVGLAISWLKHESKLSR